ncbi:MAG: TMEM14 family protein [Candidatus Methylomirabilales bacterium]
MRFRGEGPPRDGEARYRDPGAWTDAGGFSVGVRPPIGRFENLREDTVFALARYTLLAYGVLLILGGVMGYAKGRSQASLLSGGVSGVVILGVFAWSLTAATAAMWLGAGVAALLTVVMGVRFMRSRKFMPAGVVVVASLLTLAVTLAAALGSGAGP